MSNWLTEGAGAEQQSSILPGRAADNVDSLELACEVVTDTKTMKHDSLASHIVYGLAVSVYLSMQSGADCYDSKECECRRLAYCGSVFSLVLSMNSSYHNERERETTSSIINH